MRLRQVLAAGQVRVEAKRARGEGGLNAELIENEDLRSIVLSFVAQPTPVNLRGLCVDVTRFCSLSKASACTEIDWQRASELVPFNREKKGASQTWKLFFKGECASITRPIPKGYDTELPPELFSRPSTMQARGAAIGALVRGHEALFLKLRAAMREYTSHGFLDDDMARKLVRSIGAWYTLDRDAIDHAIDFITTNPRARPAPLAPVYTPPPPRAAPVQPPGDGQSTCVVS